MNRRVASTAAALVLLAAAPAAAAPRHVTAPRAVQIPRGTLSHAARRPADDAAVPTCSVTMAPVAFGPAPARGQAVPIAVAVVCPSAVRYRLVLEQPDGCAAPRTLGGAFGTLAYRVLTPQAEVWCDGSAGTAVIAGVGTGDTQTFLATAVIVDDVAHKHAGAFAGTLTGTVQLDP